MTDYQEYPKFIRRENGRSVIAQSAEEEDRLTAGEPVVREADERARLFKVAEVKDVKIDKRWALDRIRQTITDAGFDPDLNPFE